MIISFSVANFRSFLSEETLSLVASKRLSGSHDDHKVAIPASSESALRTAVIYGANGSGKSNLFKALRYLKQMATKTRPKGAATGREPFRFAGDHDTPSSFDLQFIASGTVYRYALRVDDTRVLEEWLARVSRGRERVLYERITDAEGKVTIDAPGFSSQDKISVLASLGGPHNQTFLATIHATLDASDFSEDIQRVLRWFTVGLRLIAPNETIEPVGHMLSTDPTFLQFAGEFLKNSSTGVDHLEVDKVELTEEELQKILPKTFMDRLLEDIRNDEDNKAIVQYGEGKELLIERKDSNHFYRITIRAAHSRDHDGRSQLSLAEESDGTRRLLQLIPALHLARDSSSVYVVDEIDRSMHPMLIWKFVESFIRSCSGRESQLIATTHESNLLDLDLIRRDEVWFLEKDHTLASHVYSLMDFKIRKDLEVRKHYLQGRFGAVPFLGNIDRLTEEVT
jgi:hypothetical protein